MSRRKVPLRPFVVAFALLAAGAWLAWGAPSGQSTRSEQTRPADAGITATYALGEVTAADPAGLKLTIRTNMGDVSVTLDDKTQYLRLAPGETKLDKAQPIALADIGAGDRVLARGKVADDRKSVMARQLIVMSKAEIARKQEKEREEWLRRSIAGTVLALNPAAREISLQTRTREGLKQVMVTGADKALYRRYAPGSVRFADARPSSLAELKVGDSARVLGEKSADGAAMLAEQIVSGSFLMVSGSVTAVNVAAGEITVKNLASQKPVTVVVSRDSVLRRIPPQMAARLSGRPEAAGTPQPAGQRGAEFRQRGEAPSGAPENGQAGERRGTTGGRGPASAAGGDIQDMLERLPAITPADLKPGEFVLVSSAAGADPSRVTAILLAAGAEALLSRPQGGQGATPGASLGLPGGALDFEIGLPQD